MGRQQLDIDDRQAGRGECAHRRQHRVVLEVLVVDGVELAERDEVQCVVHLDAQPAVVGQQSAQRSGEAQEIGYVRVDVVGDHEIRRTVIVPHRSGELLVEKCRHCRYSALAGGGSDIHRRLDAETRYARGDHMLEQVAVVACDLDDERIGSQPEGFSGVVDETLRVLHPAVGVRREVCVLGERVLRRDQRGDLK